LRQLEGRTLRPRELETQALAQSLVEQARRAFQAQEWDRAINLATKARTLAEDLAAATR
jgi:hypothetical protein